MMMKIAGDQLVSSTEAVSPMKVVSCDSDDGSTFIVSSSEINENDVLCGRGAFANRHSGNRRFRELVTSYQEAYLSAKILEKSQIAASVVDIIKSRKPAGRFLKREAATSDTCAASNTNEEGEDTEVVWRVISDRCAKDKTSQALREKAPEVRKRLSAMAEQYDYHTLHPQEHYAFYRGMAPADSPLMSTPPPTTEITTRDGHALRIVSAQASPAFLPKSPPFPEKPTKRMRYSLQPHHSSSSPLSPFNIGSTPDAVLPQTTTGVQINDNDVLCGRGGVTNSHIGNRRFRELVKAHQPAYLAAPKLEKADIARRIVTIIRTCDPSGRFLMKKNNKQSEGGGVWYDVGNDKAREKTSQALREKAPEIRSLYTAAATLANTPQNNLFTQGRYGLSEIEPAFHPVWIQGQSLFEPENSSNIRAAAVRSTAFHRRPHHSISRTSPVAEEREAAPGEGKGCRTATAHQSSTDNTSGIITEINDTDVLFGRGAGVNYHVGNRRFRELVKAHQPAYLAAAKLDKATISRSIVEKIRGSTPSGRFLIKADSKGDSNSDAWIDVGDERAREKTSQALREKAPELRTKKHQGTEPPSKGRKGVPDDNSYHSFHYSPEVTGMPANERWILCNEQPVISLREVEHGPFLKRRRFGPGSQNF